MISINILPSLGDALTGNPNNAILAPKTETKRTRCIGHPNQHNKTGRGGRDPTSAVDDVF
jgi:hypothetical protein